MPVGNVNRPSQTLVGWCGTPSLQLNLKPETSLAAKNAVAEKLGVDATAVALTHASDKQFRNSGLGLPGAGPSLQVITPGKVITAQTDDTVAIVHAKDGRAGVLATLPRESAELCSNAVNEKLGNSGLENVQITNAQATMFRNSGLGVGSGPVLQVLTPGHIVTAQAGDQTFTVHTDGRKALIKPQPQAERNQDGFEV
jgi:hypothetical protein